MKQEMLINVAQPEECRIAIVEDGVLEELYIERSSQDNYVGNIYKGKIVNLEPSIQAAFVDFGVGKNGFLHISDVEPEHRSKILGRVHAGPREKIVVFASEQIVFVTRVRNVTGRCNEANGVVNGDL